MLNRCYKCCTSYEDHGEPGKCPACGSWNQSARFKAEMRERRSVLEAEAAARADRHREW